MHRTLKEDTAKPPAQHGDRRSRRSLIVFVWCSTMNVRTKRLANETPGSIYVPSTRMLPSSVAELPISAGSSTVFFMVRR